MSILLLHSIINDYIGLPDGGSGGGETACVVVYVYISSSVPRSTVCSSIIPLTPQGTAQGLRRAFLSAGAIAGPLFAGALFGDMTLLTLSLVSLISVMILVLLLSFPALKRPSYSAPRREDTVVSPE